MLPSETKRVWQSGWVVGLTLLSLALPLVAVILRDEPAVPLVDPAHMSYYRQTVAALIVSLACAAAAFLGIRTQISSTFRWIIVGLASVGVLISATLLVGLIGSCGAQVISGVCQP